ADRVGRTAASRLARVARGTSAVDASLYNAARLAGVRISVTVERAWLGDDGAPAPAAGPAVAIAPAHAKPTPKMADSKRAGTDRGAFISTDCDRKKRTVIRRHEAWVRHPYI